MKRIMPAPLMSAVLWAMWLVLNDSLSLAHMVLGALLAILIPWLTDALRPEKARIRRFERALRLAGVVVYDIVVSNIELAGRILGPERNLKPRFVWLPLDIRDAHGVSALFGIISMTPGTVSVEVTPDQRFLLLHVFNVDDEAQLIVGLKQRYESPLREIFE